MARVMVSGGAGYIGTELVDQLLDAGHEVLCLDRVFFGKGVARRSPGTRGIHAHPRRCPDVRTPAHLRGVDAVMDLAGISNDPSCDLDPTITKSINLEGSVRLARLAKGAGVPRYIFSSSCSVYGHGGDVGLTEESPLAPVSLYAECKIKAEEQVLALGSSDYCVTIMRNATVYGPSRRMRYDLLVNLMTAKAFADRVIYVLGGGQQWRPNVHVRDVARAFIHVMGQPTAKTSGASSTSDRTSKTVRVIDRREHRARRHPHVSVQVVPDDPDRRTYNVCFDRISRELGFNTALSPSHDSVAEMRQRDS